LGAAGIQLLQLMDEGDIPITHANQYIALTRKQEHFLIKNSLFVVSNDNETSYVANVLGKKSIVLYSSFPSFATKPLWFPDNQITLESHRFGNKPGYGIDEMPKTINLIEQEKLSGAICDLLKINHNYDKIKTICTGVFFHHKVLEIVPDFITDHDFLQQKAINLRVDYTESINWQAMSFWCQNRKVNIMTNKVLDLNFLSHFRNNIVLVTIFLNSNITKDFLYGIKNLGLSFKILCQEPDKLKKYRFDFFDFEIIEEKAKNQKDLWNHELITEKCFFKSSKILISKGKKYSCRANAMIEKEIDVDDNRVILNDDFFKESDFFRIFQKYE
jgi:hypothetical protein